MKCLGAGDLFVRGRSFGLRGDLGGADDDRAERPLKVVASNVLGTYSWAFRGCYHLHWMADNRRFDYDPMTWPIRRVVLELVPTLLGVRVGYDRLR